MATTGLSAPHSYWRQLSESARLPLEPHNLAYVITSYSIHYTKLYELQGTPGTRTRRTPDGRALVVSAAHPIWNGDEVAGVVVVEETTNPIASLRSEALERLLLFTLIAFVAAAALLIGYASRLSHRIRMLRDEAESAIA